MLNSSAPKVRICLFSGPRVIVGSEEAPHFPRRHSAALLTLLALRPGQPITRDEIADTLWPDEALDASRRRIREHLYQLRNAIPRGRELILSDGDTLGVSQAFSVSVDLLDFDRLLKQAGETDDNDRKIRLLVQADELYCGPFAPELDWSRFDGLRSRYASLHVELLRALSILFTELDFDRAIEYGRRAVLAEPLSDGAHEELIRLYVRAGRPEDARRQYRDLEKTLKKELGTDPSREITKFVQGIDGAVSGGPVPRLLASLRIHMPGRRAARAYRAAAALSLALALVTLLASKPWRRPPLTPAERIAIVQSLRIPAGNETPNEREDRFRKRADECLALAEEAWKAWWGPEEQTWVDRLNQVDEDLERSLAWTSKHDVPREIQLSGALARYWVFPESRLLKEVHWLNRATRFNDSVSSQAKARALVGISRYYLLLGRERARPGLTAALGANDLYKKRKDPWGQAHSLRYVALHRHYQYDNVGAIRDFRDALNQFLRIGDERGQAQTYECMTYIDPAESSETVTLADRLNWAIKASSLYRKIKNPLGRIEGQKCLNLTSRHTLLSPNTPKMRALMNKLRQECREWLRIEAESNDLLAMHQLWISLGETALKLDDWKGQAECLIPLDQTSSGGTWDDEAVGRLAGAYMQYRSLDDNRERNAATLRRSIANILSLRYIRPKQYAGFVAGGRMKLADAVRLAISR